MSIKHTLGLMAAALLAGTADAQYVYPAKGQSAQRQMADQNECQVWAQGQAGANAPAAPVARGMARGALGGAAIAGISGGDAGSGAAAGAVIGGIRGGVRQQRSVDDHQRAYGACLEGRGYTVK